MITNIANMIDGTLNVPTIGLELKLFTCRFLCGKSTKFLHLLWIHICGISLGGTERDGRLWLGTWMELSAFDQD